MYTWKTMRYCPVCHAEYAPGTERCHDCEFDLVDTLEEAPEEATPEPPPGNLVTIAAFENPLQASILASALEAQGIECFIADAETIAMNGLLTGVVGGVKVRVREADAPRAAEVARRQAPARPASPTCPRCGKANARRKGLSIPLALLAVFTLGLLALFLTPRWRCTDCAHEWGWA